MAIKKIPARVVLKDTLKILLIEQANPDTWREKLVRKMLVFVDFEALAGFGPKAWVTQAWATFKVETHVCEIPPVHWKALIEAQMVQDLRSDIQ